ncbi:hypothetical protein SISNIDRAFT_449814 [Sistotremastrum niveocremeum HHB9708]|uniref:Uncharacterized protein n=1 Tax=Sistotremastrum niveocremeum HHB9708 TaxID=1314777 RepID=A0A164YNQ8_9AGAM|nr:hypothetical protein SISNIDRAFT_449814 [Sistotremastrum niveocremeum HHB9708]
MSPNKLSDAELTTLILEQEKTLQFPRFTFDDAFTIGSALRANFLKNPAWENRGLVISISTFTGHTLFVTAVGNDAEAVANNWLWVEAKKRVVARFNHSSFYVGRKLAAEGKTPEDAGLHFPEFAPHGGAFPVYIKGSTVAPVAVIIVSGLPQEEDHQLVVDTLTDIIPKMGA